MKNSFKTLWNANKRGLVILGAVATAAVSIYTTHAYTQYLNALAETEKANSEI